MSAGRVCPEARGRASGNTRASSASTVTVRAGETESSGISDKNNSNCERMSTYDVALTVQVREELGVPALGSWEETVTRVVGVHDDTAPVTSEEVLEPTEVDELV